MSVAPAFAAFVLIASHAHAQATADELSRCAALRTSALRLQCYDALAKPKVPVPSVPPVGQIGRWTVSRETDPISDQKGVTFTLSADEADALGLPALIIRCKRNDLDLYVATGEYLGRYHDDIKIRLGTDPATDESWSLSSDNTALFHPGDRPGIEAFIRTLARYDRVAFQVRPYEKAPMSMVFTLAGVGRASEELFATCPPTDTVARQSPPAASRDLDDQVYLFSVVDEKPQMLSPSDPPYPDLLRQARVQGRVVVQAIVDTLGRAEPASIKVIESSNVGFNSSARSYVLQAMFRPGRVHGRPVRVLLTLPIDFNGGK